MKEDFEYRRMAKYLAGECTAEEEREVEKWLKQEPNRDALMGELRQIWYAKQPNTKQHDVSSSLERLEKRLDADSEASSGTGYGAKEIDRIPAATGSAHHAARVRSRKQQRRSAMHWIMRTAAVLLIAAGITALSIFLYQTSVQETAELMGMREVVTGHGERATIVLDDGSQVRLNVGSSLMIPETFGENTRTVHLSGEAFFDIVPDSRSFRVHTDIATAEVLGTRFNVYSYEEEPCIKLIVTEGSVRLLPSEETYGRHEGVMLSSGEMGIIDRLSPGEITMSHHVDVDRFIAWRENKLIFEDTPLEQAARVLNRWYGVEVYFSDPEISGLRLSASFRNEPLPEVIRVMALSLNLSYEVKDREIHFKPSE
ncbi:FecR domain-containing protein [Balneolales bacterium ANBcel1]|nr:FecR domain-containing protein [Balneolales bacterium ANBcel1]